MVFSIIKCSYQSQWGCYVIYINIEIILLIIILDKNTLDIYCIYLIKIQIIIFIEKSLKVRGWFGAWFKQKLLFFGVFSSIPSWQTGVHQFFVHSTFLLPALATNGMGEISNQLLWPQFDTCWQHFCNLTLQTWLEVCFINICFRQDSIISVILW